MTNALLDLIIKGAAMQNSFFTAPNLETCYKIVGQEFEHKQ